MIALILHQKIGSRVHLLGVESENNMQFLISKKEVQMDMVATAEIMDKMLSPSKCTKDRTESKSLASQVIRRVFSCIP